MKRFKSPPSPALVVSVAAIVFAIAGTAFAGVATISALSKDEKKQIRKIARKMANKRISARTAKIADGRITARAPGLSVKAAETAATADRLSTQFWAVVDSDGTLARSSAGIVGSGPTGATGVYLVTVDRDVSQCSYQVSIEGNDPGDTDNGETSANPESGSPNAERVVRVGVFSPAGAPVDEGFMLLITC